MRKLILPLTIGLCFGATAAIAGEEMTQVEVEADIPEITDTKIQVVFDDLDADGDRIVTVTEAGTYAEIDAQFDALDTDGDGQLTEDEFLVVTDWEVDLEPEQRELIVFVDERAGDIDETALTAEVASDESADFGPDDTGDLSPDEDPDKFDSDWDDTQDEDVAVAVEVEDDASFEAEADIESDLETDASIAVTETEAVEVDETETAIEAESDLDADTTIAATDVESDVAVAGGTKMEAEIDIEKVRVTDRQLEFAPQPVVSEDLYVIFESIDVDGSQYIDRSEAAAIEGLEPLFVELDTDANGELEIQEFDVLVQAR